MPAAKPPLPWLMPVMMSHEELNGGLSGALCPAFHSDSTSFATVRAQIIQTNMLTPHQVHTIWKEILDFSGEAKGKALIVTRI